MGRKKEVVFDEQPPDFDPANPYKDPVAMMRTSGAGEMDRHRDLQDKLRWCYRRKSSPEVLFNTTWIPLVVLVGVKRDDLHPDQHTPRVQSLE